MWQFGHWNWGKLTSGECVQNNSTILYYLFINVSAHLMAQALARWLGRSVIFLHVNLAFVTPHPRPNGHNRRPSDSGCGVIHCSWQCEHTTISRGARDVWCDWRLARILMQGVGRVSSNCRRILLFTTRHRRGINWPVINTIKWAQLTEDMSRDAVVVNTTISFSKYTFTWELWHG